MFRLVSLHGLRRGANAAGAHNSPRRAMSSAAGGGGGGKGLALVAAAGVAGTAGAVGYAGFDKDFRRTLDENVPGADALTAMGNSLSTMFNTVSSALSTATGG